MNPTWSCALFDLDGTIIDSAPGITATLAWVFEQLDRPIPTPVELLDWVGPPILDSFRDRAGMSPAQSQRALEMYRPRYLEMGLFDSAVYPGVAEVLRGVAESPLPLALATSKPELAAITALEHYGLADYFDVITGASEDEVRSSK
ncbi:MAG TPA: HAD hydrolase-like protein, partial [Lacisediminihabitans sp.]|uniref:HAD hydrolase-like protein n=1 Tax=Lacisediminihabitans sp. TaxID=2787631 RepID=UPI002ED7B26D